MIFEVADMAQLVEQRIRNAWVAGSSPAIGSLSIRSQSSSPQGTDSFFMTFCRVPAELAQLVEHWLPKPMVAGSSPVFRSKTSNHSRLN